MKYLLQCSCCNRYVNTCNLNRLNFNSDYNYLRKTKKLACKMPLKTARKIILWFKLNEFYDDTYFIKKI